MEVNVLDVIKIEHAEIKSTKSGKPSILAEEKG